MWSRTVPERADRDYRVAPQLSPRVGKDCQRQSRNRLLVRFEDQSLTSHAGLVAFQDIFFASRPEGAVRLVLARVGRVRAARDGAVAGGGAAANCATLAHYRNDEAVRLAVGQCRLPDVSALAGAGR